MERIVGLASPYTATPLGQTVKGRWCVFPEVIGTDSKHFGADPFRQHRANQLGQLHKELGAGISDNRDYR
jgi:hypothetical protein